MLLSTVITGEGDNASTQVGSVLKQICLLSLRCDFLIFALLPVFLISFLCV